uniref:Ubiquitin-like 3b n=1 Tax=Oreochromis niloticus TaxID=8128 RepID=A0A669F4J1_ORENI
MTTQRDLDMVHLRLILVSGKTQDFTFSPNDSATDIAKHVFDNWPAGWEEERVSSPSILRLIFQGRFLHGNVTLGAQPQSFGCWVCRLAPVERVMPILKLLINNNGL